MFNKIENLKQYLLGNLTHKETETIDLAIISDKILEEKLLIAEHDLIEDFLEDSLSEGEIELFYRNFLISPERENQVVRIAGLKKYAGIVKSKKVVPVEEERSSENFWQKLRKGLFLQPVRAVVAVLMIGVFLGVIWLTIINNSGTGELSPLEAEFAELNKADFGEIERFQKFEKLSLISGSSRSADNSRKLKKENITEKVFFRLAVPEKTSPGEVFTVEFEQNGKVVFTQNQIPVFKKENAEEFRFLAPASIFKPGDYLIRAQSDKTSEIIYSFVVE